MDVAKLVAEKLQQIQQQSQPLQASTLPFAPMPVAAAALPPLIDFSRPPPGFVPFMPAAPAPASVVPHQQQQQQQQVQLPAPAPAQQQQNANVVEQVVINI